MSGRRIAVLLTAVLVTILAVLLVMLRWDDANKVAVVASALAAVAAVGVGVWAALPRTSRSDKRSSGPGWRVSQSGSATAGRSGRAVSGITDQSGSLPDEVQVDRSGDARTGDDGDAVSGISKE